MSLMSILGAVLFIAGCVSYITSFILTTVSILIIQLSPNPYAGNTTGVLGFWCGLIGIPLILTGMTLFSLGARS